MSESTKRFIIRQRFLMIQAIRQGMLIAHVAKQFGCSRKTVYKWLHRYTHGGLKDLLDRSRRPHGHPKSLEPSLARLIAKLRQQTHYGPIRLQWLLWERHRLHVSRWGIYQALKRQGLITRGRRRHKKDYRLYTLPTPGQEIQIDTKHLCPRNPIATRYFQYTAVDDCTRLRVLRIYDELTLHHSLEFLREVVTQMPFKIQAIRTDGGIEFTYPMPTPKIHPFTQACQKLGIEHRVNRPGYPQANGKVERSHRTDNEEFYRVTPQARWSTNLPGWEHHYNYQRSHQSLHGLSPMEYWLALQSTGRSVTYVRG
jgi:transposase